MTFALQIPLFTKWRKHRHARFVTRVLWMPILRERAGAHQCMLSEKVQDTLIAFIHESLDQGRDTQWIRHHIDNHIQIGLDQPQCWVKYLIG